MRKEGKQLCSMNFSGFVICLFISKFSLIRLCFILLFVRTFHVARRLFCCFSGKNGITEDTGMNCILILILFPPHSNGSSLQH